MRIKLLSDKPRGEVCKKALIKEGFELVDKDPDIIVVAGYGRLLEKEEYENVKYGAINLHAGPLPKYKGASPLNWLIIDDRLDFEISIIQIDEGIDTGDILAQQKVFIMDSDNIESLSKRVDETYASMLPELLDRISVGEAKRERHIGGSQMTRRFPKDHLILWDMMSAEEVHNLVRASKKGDYPAFTYNGTNRINIYKTSLTGDFFGVPGRVAYKNESVVVICKDSGLEILDYDGHFPRIGEDLLTVKGFIYESLI